MPLIASNGLTEAGTSKIIVADDMPVHYHDLGEGEPVLFLHSYGPGTTAWITFHKTVGAASQHFRCILMDLPNFSKTGPIVYREGVHAVQARTAVALLDALGIARAYWVGNSQGGQSAMVAAITYPDRVRRFVMGGSHIGTGGDRYLLANRPSEGSRATRRTLDDPSPDNIRHYLRVHIDDESLVTDGLVGARPAGPLPVPPDGAFRGQHRDPEPPRAAQQLRPLAAIRAAGRVGRPRYSRS